MLPLTQGRELKYKPGDHCNIQPQLPLTQGRELK